MLAGSERMNLVFSAIAEMEAKNADKSGAGIVKEPSAPIVQGGDDKNQVMPTALAMA